MPTSEPTYLLRACTLPLALAGAMAAPLTAAAQPGAGPVYVNELVADNETGATDEEGKFEDWIELYNGSAAAVSLAGYTLSDDPARPDKWPFPPEASIPAGGYLIAWCDEDQEDGPLHTNFKLARTGETISLYDAGGTLVDEVTYPELTDDQAYARRADGNAEFVIQAPTFASSNDGSLALREADAYAGFRVWPTVAAPGTARVLEIPVGVREVVVAAVDGREVARLRRTATEADSREDLSLGDAPVGTYLVTARGDAGARTLRILVR